jgi:hypothetical protein
MDIVACLLAPWSSGKHPGSLHWYQTSVRFSKGEGPLFYTVLLCSANPRDLWPWAKSAGSNVQRCDVARQRDR